MKNVLSLFFEAQTRSCSLAGVASSSAALLTKHQRAYGLGFLGFSK